MKASPDPTCTANHCISSIPTILKILISGRKEKQNKTKKYCIQGHQAQMMGERHHIANREEVYNVPLTLLSVTMARLVSPHMPANYQAS